MNPAESSNSLTLSSSQNPQEENQEKDLTFGMSREEMTEMPQNLDNHRIINIMMRLNPSLYMLELAKQGAKLPSYFDVSTIVETSFPPISSTIPISSTPPSQNIMQNIPQITTSFAPTQPNVNKGSAFLNALQTHPLVNNQNLDANTTLEQSIPQNPLHKNAPLTFHHDPSSSFFHATPQTPLLTNSQEEGDMFGSGGIFDTMTFSQQITPLTFPPLPPLPLSSTPLPGLGLPPLPSINQTYIPTINQGITPNTQNLSLISQQQMINAQAIATPSNNPLTSQSMVSQGPIT